MKVGTNKTRSGLIPAYERQGVNWCSFAAPSTDGYATPSKTFHQQEQQQHMGRRVQQAQQCLVAVSRFAYGLSAISAGRGRIWVDIVGQLAALGVLNTDLLLYTRRRGCRFRSRHSLWMMQR
jgi:hypothetical protein